jgi:MFS family permease
MAALAGCGLLLYSGSVAALFIGYTLGVLAGGVIAPPLGAMVNEIFPTAVRASVAGWSVAASVLGAVAGLVVFGTILDLANRLGLAAAVTFLPAVPVAALLLGLPETRGLEPEQLAPAV